MKAKTGGAGFTRLIHADWSKSPKGRWAASARRCQGGWAAEAPYPVPPLERYVDDLLSRPVDGPTLAGFDFPIGLPVAYGRRTGFAGFLDALPAFGKGEWSEFYEVAKRPAEVSRARPFYPAAPGGSSRQHLLDGHDVADFASLTRGCERGGPGRKAAGCLFWTLGSNQVGKAMMTGWREVVVPARHRGAHLWPFDGTLVDLAGQGGLTLAETYPADVYGFLGAAFRPGESKRRQSDRTSKAPALLGWAARARVELAPALRTAIVDGFGPVDKGGDRFDAVVGLFGMIAVVDGIRPDGYPVDDDTLGWEGWILGRQS